MLNEKLKQLINSIELKNKEHEKELLERINSNNRSNLTFKSIDEYYNWVNSTIEKLGLNNNDKSEENNNIITSTNYDIESNRFNLFIKENKDPINLNVDNNYNMNSNEINKYYEVNIIINNKYVITICREFDLMKANNKYDYLCMLFLNDKLKLLEEIEKVVV